MKTIRRSGVVALVALVVSGCGAEPGDGDFQEDVGSVQQYVSLTWQGTGVFAPHTVGMAINNKSLAFQWTDLDAGGGKQAGCFGPIGAPCSGTVFAYVSGFVPSRIRGIGVSQVNGMVYTWGSTPGQNGGASFSKGTKENLGPIQPFLTPPGVTIDQLIEVDQSSSGTWQFWWSVDGSVKRSLSSSPGIAGNIGAGTVQVLPNKPIVGIAIRQGTPNTVWTYYSDADSTLNMSTDAMNLAQ